MNERLDVFLVVGELSGDQLGAGLMRALRRRLGDAARFRGVGGPAMAKQGLESRFPLDDIAVMGLAAVVARLPTILRRARETIRAILAEPPDVLVIIDSPDFTHAVAKRVRRGNPAIPIIDYVSPSVWAWRPGRAKAMRAYTDHLLALLPFEPEVHQRLGGPPTTYVGHPLIERLAELRPDREEAAAREQAKPLLLVLPGSRGGEIRRLIDLFGDVVARLHEALPPFDVMLPAVPRHAGFIREKVAAWPVAVEVVEGETAKLAGFRRAWVALAASGTVTLELALAGVPHVGAYRVPAIEAAIGRRVIRTPWALLPNIILGERAVPEFLQEHATVGALTGALVPLFADSPERAAQLAAFARIDKAMQLPAGETPSDRAAAIIIDVARRGR